METYPEEPLDEEFLCAEGLKWVVWEQYENAPGAAKYKQTVGDDKHVESWKASMQKVAWFNDMITFGQLWRTMPFSDLGHYFFDKEGQQVPVYQVQGALDQKRISTLGLF